jgi:puromycin-sensitive aminopeptidase
VWSVVFGALGLLDRIVPDGDRPVLAGAVRALVGPVVDALGWSPRDDDNERTASLRSMGLRALGTIGEDPETRAEAARLFAGSEDHPLHPDTEGAILDIVATDGGADEFDIFLGRYRKPANPQEENRYLYALTSFRQPELADRLFDLLLSEVRTQNAPYVLSALITNRVTGPAVWERMTREWDALVAKFPSNSLTRMIDGARTLCSPPDLAEGVTAFIESHPLPGRGKAVEQILERLAVSVAFGLREAPGLAATLTEVLEPTTP